MLAYMTPVVAVLAYLSPEVAVFAYMHPRAGEPEPGVFGSSKKPGAGAAPRWSSKKYATPVSAPRE